MPLNLGDMLKAYPQIAVLRRTDWPEGKVFNNLGKLRDDAIAQFFSPSKIPNMSLNLLGGGFQPEHIRYNPTGIAAKDWDGMAYIFLLNFASCIKILDQTECCSIYFWAKDLHGKDCPATIVLNKDTRRILEKLKLPQPPTESISAYIPCRADLIHVPTCLNYWHIQFTLTGAVTGNEQIIDEAKSGYKRMAAEYALDHILSVNAKKGLVEYDPIPWRYYQKIERIFDCWFFQSRAS